MNKCKYYILSAFVTFLFFSCRKWENHNQLNDVNGPNLLEQLKANSETTTFASLVEQSIYKDSLTGSRIFTVFSPDNEALATIAPALLNDSASLNRFVGNHLAYQIHLTKDGAGQRIGMASKKYHAMSNMDIDGISYVKTDIMAKNGVLHIINDGLLFLPNVWEFVVGNAQMPSKQRAFMVDSLVQKVFSPSTAVQIGTDSAGNPVYQPGTDSIETNRFWNDVYDVRDETRQFTLFVLADEAWEEETAKFAPFSVSEHPAATSHRAGWTVMKDLAVNTSYDNPAAVPDTILSKFQTKVGVNKTEIASVVPVSNGVIYIMKKLPVLPEHKFRDIIIEAENYTSASHSRPGNTYFRDRIDSLTGNMFRDVLVYNHGVARFNLRYRLRDMPSMKYKVYWMALNDNINGRTTPFAQKIGVDSFNSPLPAYVDVPVNNYYEQEAGEFTLATYRPVFNLFLTSANSTSESTNPLVCNYIRIRPVF